MSVTTRGWPTLDLSRSPDTLADVVATTVAP